MSIVGKNGYAYLFSALQQDQTAPPLFLIISKFLMNILGQAHSISGRDLTLKLLPCISGVLSLPLFAFVMFKITKNRFVILTASAILAFNKYAINYSQEFKQYSTEMLVTIILFYAFLNFDIKKDSIQKVTLYTILFSLAPWFSYSSIFILIPGTAFILFDIIKNKYFNKNKFLVFCVPALISAIAFYIHYKAVSNVHMKFMLSFWQDKAFFGNGYNEWLFNCITNSLLSFISIKSIFFILIFSLIVFIYTNKENKRILYYTIAPIFLCYTACFLERWPYRERLILFLLPLFAIIISSLANYIKEIKSAKIFVSIFLLIFSAMEIAIPAKTRDVIPSIAKLQMKTIAKENKTMKNVLGFGPQSYYYMSIFIDPDNPPKNTFITYRIPRKFEIQEFENKLAAIPKNEVVWIYAPHYFDPNEDNYILSMKKYIENNKKFKVDELWFDNENKGYVMKFRKI